ncbi:MAG: HD domain-containing protein [Firmicutes bacterium]|nr:HD domain-containing protein [Bacillota bacterium]
MQKEFFVNTLNVDDDFTDFFLVKDISVKIGSNHKKYLDLTLSDRTGDINGKKWDVSDEEEMNLSRIKAGDYVKVHAQVNEWNNTRQLRVLRIRKGQKEDKLDLSEFITAAPEDPEEMYEFLVKKAESIGDEGLRKMALKFLTDEKSRLLYYPAAMKNHHAEYAGLLWHMKRMLMLGERACEVYDILDRDWIVCGVILHDMEKLNEIQSNELGISPGYTFEGQLLGHITQGIKTVELMAREIGLDAEKTVMLEHMIESHHYEPDFGSPKKPMFAEAEMLHYLDMVDSKLFDYEEALAGVAPGCFSDRVRTLDGRMLYKPTFSKIK